MVSGHHRRYREDIYDTVHLYYIYIYTDICVFMHNIVYYTYTPATKRNKIKSLI